MQQQPVRSSVASLMMKQPTAMDAALIRQFAAPGLDEALAHLPARKGSRQ